MAMIQGQCPKCGALEVYISRDTSGQVALRVNMLNVAELVHYVCTSCGYTEAYVADGTKLRDIRKSKSWGHIRPPAPPPLTDHDQTQRLPPPSDPDQTQRLG